MRRSRQNIAIDIHFVFAPSLVDMTFSKGLPKFLKGVNHRWISGDCPAWLDSCEKYPAIDILESLIGHWPEVSVTRPKEASSRVSSITCPETSKEIFLAVIFNLKWCGMSVSKSPLLWANNAIGVIVSSSFLNKPDWSFEKLLILARYPLLFWFPNSISKRASWGILG